MTAPVRSIRVWVAVDALCGQPMTSFSLGEHEMIKVWMRRKDAAWEFAEPIARATLVLDQPKPKKVRCPDCAGHGEIGCQNEYHKCPRCKGTGERMKKTGGGKR